MTDKTTGSALPNQDRQRLLKELNDSGFPFQHSVVEVLQKQREWTLVNTEFPVSDRGRTTHVDILAWCHQKALMVAECKRVNPAYGDWLFMKLPASRHDISRDSLFEQLFITTDEICMARTAQFNSWVPHHIGLEVKTHAKGDAKGQARSLRDAVTQVQFGTNALITRLAHNPVLWRQARLASVILLPVIITTAHLYSTDADLGSADIETGHIADDARVERVDWVWLEDNISPDLLHETPSLVSRADLFAIVRDRHARSIAVVTATAVDAFLKHVAHTMYHHF